jgi:hypothetical protein
VEKSWGPGRAQGGLGMSGVVGGAAEQVPAARGWVRPAVYKIQYKFQISSDIHLVQKVGSKALKIQIKIWSNRI